MPEHDDAPYRRRWWSRRRDEALATPVDANQLALEGLPGPTPGFDDDLGPTDQAGLEERLELLEREVSDLRDRLGDLEDRLGDQRERPETVHLPETASLPADDILRKAVEGLRAEIEAVRRVRRGPAQDDDRAADDD